MTIKQYGRYTVDISSEKNSGVTDITVGDDNSDPYESMFPILELNPDQLADFIKTLQEVASDYVDSFRSRAEDRQDEEGS